MDKLDIAIAQFADETLEITMGERLNLLGDALMWNAYQMMARIKKHGTKNPLSEEEQYKQEECMNQYNIMRKMYEYQMKANKMSGKTQESMNAEFMKHLREMKSSIGDIITTIPSQKQ